MKRNRCDHCPHCQALAVQAPEGKTDTSRAAAATVRPHLSATEWTLLQILHNPSVFGGKPSTSNLLAKTSGIPLGTVRPRMTYLRQIGRVKDSGQRARIGKNSRAICWELVK